MSEIEKFLELAHQLADAARLVIRPYYRQPIAIDNKSDDSPVTIADREAERVMRVLIRQTFPDHGILGEEWGGENLDAEYVWVLDPIDGTKSFITGVPLFATLIALTYKGEVVLGVVDQVILDERWVGIAGQPATLNGKPIQTRQCPSLGLACLFTSGPEYYLNSEDRQAYDRLNQVCGLKRYSADSYAFTLLAAGFVDIVVEAGMKPYDVLALVPIVEGAGGAMRGWGGEVVNLRTDGRVIAVGDKQLIGPALERLQP